MNQIEGNLIIKNHRLCDKSNFTPQTNFVYEVIKVENSVPIFLKEHYDRLLASNDNNSYGLSYRLLRNEIQQLVDANDLHNCNVKIVCDTDDVYLMFIKSFYPDEKYHDFGADVVTANIMRNNPNKKYFNPVYVNKASSVRNDNEVYEVLLVNNEGFITEGSRSNVFFIKNNVIFTAPDNLVLIGVTRNKVIETIKELGVPLVMHAVHENDIYDCDAAFLTGTSINVFKIRKINDFEFEDEPELLTSISNQFLKKISDAISEDGSDSI